MKKPDNLILIIFGASGDLASRKLIPALFSLKLQELLPEKMMILGAGRFHFTDEEFREKMVESIKSFSEEKELDDQKTESFAALLSYIRVDYNDSRDFGELKKKLYEVDKSHSTGGNYIFYMATPPGVYKTISENLAGAGLADQSEGFRRFIYEKPFGNDLESAMNLNHILHEMIGEDQIYRIDHYLGKETVQNILVTRFANGIFEPLWNRNYIHRVEITSSESIGVEERGSYYDSSGALRDMVQNHLLQMTGLTAMEPPSSLEPDAVRNEILKILQSLQPVREEDVPQQVIRGQYTGSLIRGECVPGYREEKDVAADSMTETYVAMKFFINNWRWGGVPFYIRTGKRMPARVTEIVIYFKRTPHHLFQRVEKVLTSNMLIIRIQPDEGILFKFDMKEPGSGFKIKNVNMDFHYKDLADTRVPSAYERLLYDVMTGDSTLFARNDEVETAWKFIDPIQLAWKNNPEIKLYGYPAGTWGPSNANEIIEGCGLDWRFPCKNLTDDSSFCEL